MQTVCMLPNPVAVASMDPFFLNPGATVMHTEWRPAHTQHSTGVSNIASVPHVPLAGSLPPAARSGIQTNRIEAPPRLGFVPQQPVAVGVGAQDVQWWLEQVLRQAAKAQAPVPPR